MKDLTTCLACGGEQLTKYLDLGSQPLANNFHDGTKPLQEYPLAVNVCRQCWHSQLTVAVDPRLMFDEYLYVSGTSRTLRNYMRGFATRFPPGARVLDIASNDGTLLRALTDRGCEAWGVEPCLEIGLQGILERTIPAYWDHATAKVLRHKAPDGFDAIVMMNVLGHTADPLEFLKLAKDVLAPNGTIWVQTSQSNMVMDGSFDAIYHEHVSYFTPRSLSTLAYRADLHAVSFETMPIHGGSMLVGFTHGSEAQVTTHLPLYEIESYAKFRRTVETTIHQARGAGIPAPIIGYGAAAKGNTFLNATGIRMDSIVDDNPAKWGWLTPGRNIPVHAPDQFKPAGEGMVIVLAWNFWDEIVERIRDRHGSGHSCMRFLPKIELVMT